MILLDSSVWIAAVRLPPALDLDAILDSGEVVTCLPVIQEVLQGVREERLYRIAREALFDFPRVEDPITASLVEEAVALYRAARRVGTTPRSSVDCLIAACAIRHDFEVLHRDRDYDLLARVSPLRVRRAC